MNPFGRKCTMAEHMGVADETWHRTGFTMVDGVRFINIDFRGIRYKNAARIYYDNIIYAGERTKFNCAEEMQGLIDKFFASHMDYARNKWGEILYDGDGSPIFIQARPYTVTGLALELGISPTAITRYRRGMFDNLRDEPEIKFSKILQEALYKIELQLEGKLLEKDSHNGARYILDCKYGWGTRKEQAEIAKIKAETSLKAKEFQLKKSLLEDDGEDGMLELKIVRKTKD